MKSALDTAAKHCLHVLGTHMDSRGYGFPSIETVAREASMTPRTASPALNRAAAQGWISRESRRDAGKAWRRYAYRATIPDGQEVFSPPSTSRRHGEEKNDRLVRKQFPTNSPMNREVYRGKVYRRNDGHDDFRAELQGPAPFEQQAASRGNGEDRA